MNDQQIKEMENNQPVFFQPLLDASINGILVLKPLHDTNNTIKDFIVTAANSAITTHVQVALKDAISKTMSELFPGYKESGFFDAYVAAYETGELQRKELPYKDPRLEGWYEISVAPAGNMVVVSFANITHQKLQQIEIVASAARLDAIINTSQSGIFLFKPVFGAGGELTDFQFTKANPALASYVGQDQSVLIGALGSKWFPSYKTNGLFALYSETYKTGKTNRFDFHYNADGIDVWLDIMSNRLDDEVLVTFTDYTPVKRLQLELEKTVNELKRSNTNLEEFAYVASHDLQEPLRKIQYFANKLRPLYSDQAGAEASIDRIEDATARMRLLIEDLLTYSKFSFKTNTSQPVDLNVVVKRVLVDLETAISETKAAIVLHPLPAVAGDKLQLGQLFQNLIGNALKYRRDDVPLQITISSKDAEMLHPDNGMQQEDQGMYYQIEIEDNGVGFDQAYASQIFKIFQRLHGRSEYPGTGVGLAIVQKVVENHKGCIFAEGTPGQGSVFKVLLPKE